MLPPDPHASSNDQIAHLQALVMYNKLSQFSALALEAPSSLLSAEIKAQPILTLRPVKLRRFVLRGFPVTVIVAD
jgi:hypothetical protein